MSDPRTAGACTSGVIEAARRRSRLPEPQAQVISNLLRDGVAVLLAGMPHPTVRILVDHVRTLGSPRQGCALVGAGATAAPQEAAFVYATAMHVLDLEPMFLPPTHAVSPVLGALLAVAQAEPRDADGRRFQCALAAGIQLQADLRRLAAGTDRLAVDEGRHFPFQRQGFHPPGTVGPMGAALACGLWLELHADALAAALGIAASRAGALSANIGTMTKATHCGHAARVGVEAALLARRGLSASRAIFDAPGGWVEVFGGAGFDAAELVTGMASLRCFTDPGFAFKRWPAHTAMQIAIEAGLAARGSAPPRALRIWAPRFPYCDRPSPSDGDAARFSFQYNVAVAVLDGRVDFDTHSAARLGAADVQRLLGQTTLTLDPDVPTAFDAMTVTVETDAGRRAVADRWSGHWRSPAPDAQLEDKFHRCARRLVSSEAAAALHAAVQGVGSPGGLGEFLTQLGAIPPP